MKGIAPALVTALVGWASLACGGGGLPVPGRSTRNSAACLAYRDLYDALPCVGEDLPADFCPEAMDSAPCDLTPYYACLRAGVRCNGALLDATDALACATECVW